MKLMPIAAAALLAVSSLAHADTLNLGNATLTYDSNDLLGVSAWNGSFFEWSLPKTSVISGGPIVTKSLALPTFTLEANAGYTLSGSFGAFLGDLAYTEYGGATTNVQVYANVWVDGAPVAHLNGVNLAWESLDNGSNYNVGIFSQSGSTGDLGSYHSITISDASIVLSAANGTFSSIVTTNQNKLSFNFQVAAVPEPETYALMMAGLGVVGFLARRRKQG